MNARFLPDFKKAGFTHLSLANNHTFDYGLPGYNQTISTLWNFGFIPFGHPTIFSTSSVTFLEVGDLTISLIALHTLFSAPSTETISGVLTYATTNSDLQIVTVHWGEEYAPIHSNEQEAMAKVLAKAGADIIVGHHPHVVQDIQMVGDTLVFYSLGNFIFDQYFSVPVQQGLMLKLDSSLNISLLPYSSEEVRVQPAPMESQKAALFYQNLSRVSDTALASYIIDGFIPYRNMLASSTEVVIMTE